MEYRKKTVETLLDDKEKEIKPGDYVLYTTESFANRTILAQFLGFKGGYINLMPFGSQHGDYNVKPSAITSMIKAEDFLK